MGYGCVYSTAKQDDQHHWPYARVLMVRLLGRNGIAKLCDKYKPGYEYVYTKNQIDIKGHHY